jgi:hypothetical protein
MNTDFITEPGRDLSSPGFVITKEFWRFIMYICTFKYTPETVDCHYCTAYSRRGCKAADGCPYIAERIEAGAVDYGEVVWAMFKNPSVMLRWRLRYLVDHFEDSMWESERHEKRFHRMWAEMGTRKKRDTPQFFAALYLLTANEDVWRRAYNAFSVNGITMEYVRLCGISVPNYALVQAAKSIYLNTDHFTVADLEDSEAVSTDAFRLVVNAVLIARYGRDVLKITGQREDEE